MTGIVNREPQAIGATATGRAKPDPGTGGVRRNGEGVSAAIGRSDVVRGASGPRRRSDVALDI